MKGMIKQKKTQKRKRKIGSRPNSQQPEWLKTIRKHPLDICCFFSFTLLWLLCVHRTYNHIQFFAIFCRLSFDDQHPIFHSSSSGQDFPFNTCIYRIVRFSHRNASFVLHWPKLLILKIVILTPITVFFPLRKCIFYTHSGCAWRANYFFFIVSTHLRCPIV